MYHVSTHGVEERKINVHYYYYINSTGGTFLCGTFLYLNACHMRVTASDSGLCCHV